MAVTAPIVGIQPPMVHDLSGPSISSLKSSSSGRPSFLKSDFTSSNIASFSNPSSLSEPGASLVTGKTIKDIELEAREYAARTRRRGVGSLTSALDNLEIKETLPFPEDAPDSQSKDEGKDEKRDDAGVWQIEGAFTDLKLGQGPSKAFSMSPSTTPGKAARKFAKPQGDNAALQFEMPPSS